MPVRVAFAALAGALVAGAGASGILILLGLWVPRLPPTPDTVIVFVPTLVAGLCGALGAWAYTSRGTRLVREAFDAEEQAQRDASERNLMEASQRNAYAAVGDFATELARELAPSVASARTAMRSLEAKLHLDSPLRAPLERAQRELHRLANTMQDTLRLARSGKLSMRRIDLWIPLRNALKTATPDASARGIWIEPPPFGRAPIWINGDDEALEQLFLNLLLNAVQETESGGRVSAAVTIGDDAVVSIADTGRGIPQDALDRVFEPFFTTKSEGAGLGLAIAWRTAAAHGGRLTIESALGRGTRVDVALPRAEGSAGALAAP
ncbi:MAG TPA: HAMP domain-containing sensor histidine kinase [Gemmatimonadaceae bacterium]|nr:HAMP domain-containing sensor histidine kinase [Gemmatimonadaceae bacterium]